MKILYIATTLIALSCGKKSEDSASLSVKMTNAATSLHGDGDLSLDGSTFVTPDSLKIKIISVELVRDDGKYIAVWVNPDCAPQKWELENGKDNLGRAKMSSFYNAENCSLSSIKTYLNIAQSSAKVNAELNSQNWPVPPGSYSSVSIRMCKDGDTDADKVDSLVYKGGNMDKEHSTVNASCGVTGAPVSSIQIAPGAVAKIDLQYDAAKLFTVSTTSDVSTIPAESKSSGCYYPSSGSTWYCHQFGASTFVPRLVTE